MPVLRRGHTGAAGDPIAGIRKFWNSTRVDAAAEGFGDTLAEPEAVCLPG